ncbi:MAG: translation initiation factor IF-3 [Emergencia sp.]
MPVISKENKINEEIRDRELRVIDENGQMLGIMSRDEALNLAEEKKLDLVNISPNANPPVCKILDYGKYRYELQKREKEAKKKQKTIQVKEIRLSTFIEDHDIQVKAKTACKFLQDGDKVKVSLRFRGREKDYTARGREVMDKFAEACSDVSVLDKKPTFEGRSLTMFLAPKSDK